MGIKDNKQRKRRIQNGGKISRHKDASTFSSPEFGMTTKCPTLFIRTFGWPLVTVARDGAGGVKKDKCFRMNRLEIAIIYE